jgi:pimeloyl-ACP methyl ester carboxylesterase
MRGWVTFFLCAAVSTFVGCVAVGTFLTQPAHRSVGPPPEDFNAKAVEISTANGGRVFGWLLPGRPNNGAVLLLHGVRADRRDMVGRARFLNKLGYAILLIDLPAHGESTGEHITYGAHEAEGVKVALEFLAQSAPGERIGVVGVSLGAASLVLLKPSPSPAAVVLESMFPTIEEAVVNRLKLYLGAPGELLAPLLIEQLSVTLAISPAQLHPIEALSALHCPILFISGSIDRHTTPSETKRMFDATAEPKELWVLDGAAHVDLHAFTPQAYEAKVGGFLAKYLHTPRDASFQGTASGAQ